MAEDLLASFEAQLEAGNVPQEEFTGTLSPEKAISPTVGAIEEPVDLVTSFEQQLSGEAPTPSPEPAEERKQDLNSTASLLGLKPTELRTGGEEFKAAIAEQKPEIPEGIGKPFLEAKQRLGEAVTRLEEEAGEDFTTMDVVGAAGKLIVPIVGEGARVLAGTVLEAVPDSIKDVASNAFEAGISKIAETELGGKGLEALQSGLEKYEEFSQKHPDIAGQINGALSILEVFGAAKFAKAGFSKVSAISKARGLKAKTKTALELLKPSGKKAEQLALKEGRVLTPKTKVQKLLFGEKITPSDFETQAAEFMTEKIPKLSSNRSKAIGQVSDAVTEIDKDVTKRALKLKTTPGSLGDIGDSFLSKADDIATDFSKSTDDRAIKKFVDQFNSTVGELKTKLSSADGSVEDIRVFRKKWDKSFDKSIRSISPDDIVNKPNSTQLKWKMWMEGRGELNNKFFEIALEQGDDLMKADLKNMSLGIRSIDDIAKNGGVAKDIWRRHKAKIVSTGATILGISALN